MRLRFGATRIVWREVTDDSRRFAAIVVLLVVLVMVGRLCSNGWVFAVILLDPQRERFKTNEKMTSADDILYVVQYYCTLLTRSCIILSSTTVPFGDARVSARGRGGARSGESRAALSPSLLTDWRARTAPAGDTNGRTPPHYRGANPRAFEGARATKRSLARPPGTQPLRRSTCGSGVECCWLLLRVCGAGRIDLID